MTRRCQLISLQKIRFFLFLLPLCLLSVILNAQDVIPVIEVDSNTNWIKTVPFDKMFYLKIRRDDLPPYIEFMQYRGNRTFAEELRKRVNKMRKQDTSYQIPRIPAANYELREEAGKKWLYIKFGEHPVKYKKLEVEKKNEQGEVDSIKAIWVRVKKDTVRWPDERSNNFIDTRSNVIIILPKLYGDGLEVFNLYSDPATRQKAFNLRDAIQKSANENFGLRYHVPEKSKVERFYADSLSNFYTAIKAETKSLKDATNLKALSSAQLLKDIQIKLFIEQNAKDLAVYFDVKQTIENIRTIISLTDAQAKSLLLGEISLLNVAPTKKDDNISKRKNNLETTTSELRKLDQVVSLAKDRGWLSTGTGPVSKTLADFEFNLAAVIKIATNEKEIQKAINANALFQEPAIVSGSSVVYNFESRNKFQITPDFGYTVFGFQKGFTGFAPYLGFHINLRAIDRDILFSKYPNKTVWHYLSIMTAWTLTSIGEENKRENFFENGALITGIGVRMTNAVRFTFGNYWFYKNNPRPEIQGRKLAITPFMGLSLDLDLKSLMNDITSLKPTK